MHFSCVGCVRSKAYRANKKVKEKEEEEEVEADEDKQEAADNCSTSLAEEEIEA